MDINIDRGVPVPQAARHRFQNRYPWTEMEVGDSFVHPGNRSAVSSAMGYAASRTGHRYMSRREGAGYRIWRVA